MMRTTKPSLQLGLRWLATRAGSDKRGGKSRIKTFNVLLIDGDLKSRDSLIHLYCLLLYSPQKRKAQEEERDSSFAHGVK